MLPVFHVTDQDGNKLRDEELLDYIRKVALSTYLSAFPFFSFFSFSQFSLELL